MYNRVMQISSHGRNRHPAHCRRRGIAIIAACMATVLSLSFQAVAGNTTFRANGTVKVEAGQIVNSTTKRYIWPTDSTWLNGMWSQIIRAEFITTAQVGKRLSVVFGLEGATAFELPGISKLYEWRVPSTERLAFSRLSQAYSTFTPGVVDLAVTLGYFPFSYAPEVNCLGAYMFKTGTYPGFIISGDSRADLGGIHITAKLPSILRHDILMTTELEYEPRYDWSLTYLGRLSLGKAVEIGAGVRGERIIVAEQSRTNPTAGDRADAPVWKTGYVEQRTVNGQTVLDTVQWYRKTGVKLMARFSLDLKSLIKTDRLGENDLKLYAEAALLGAKNYPGYYEKIQERVPVMVGFNIPTFKLLDVLSVEAEYYRSPYWNNPMPEGYPIPFYTWDWETIDDPHADLGWKSSADNIKWGVYAERTIISTFRIYAKAASDHFRPIANNGSLQTFEYMHAPDEWYWRLGLAFSF